MKEISLTQGRVALVDDEDFEELNKFKWHTQPHGNTFYVIRNTPRKPGKHQGTERMHRVILNIPEGMETDHIDGDGLNNQKSNLRIATHRQNSQNLALKQTKKTSKFPGVFWDKRKSKWCACIRINGSQKHLGYFLNENEANIAYRVAEKIVVNSDFQSEREKALNYLVDTFSDIGYKNHPTTQMIKNLIKKDEELRKAGE
jgi:hypothetical protein